MKNITAGIDLGNQSCILAIPSEHGVDIVLNESSNRKNPTIVGYQEERRTAGEFAQQQYMMNIQNTITQFKRLIGLPFDSKEREIISNSVPYKIIRLDNGLSGIELDNGQILHVEQIFGFYLKSLLEILQKKNPKIEQVVLTVPTSWTEIQRRSILNAASISNVKIAELLDSSIASAIAYVKIHGDRFPEEKEKGLNVLFVEFGDTSMNAFVGQLSKNTVEIKSNVYDESLGGQHFTDILEKYLLEKVIEKYKIDPTTNKRSMIRFKQAVEKVKKTLSANPVVLFEVPSLMNDIDISMTVKRDEFNDLIKQEISQIRPKIEEAIQKAGITKEQISFVEIVGGSSRIASIKAEIKEIIGSEAKMSLDLDECFAIGAGFMAAKIDGKDIGVEVINKKCPLEIDAKDDQEEGQIIKVFTDSSSMPSVAKINVPIKEKKTLSFMCKNSKIGFASIETGVEEKVNVEIDVSIDSFGLIDIKDATFKMNSHEEEEEDKLEEEAQIEEEDKLEEEEEKAEVEEAKVYHCTSFSYTPLMTLSEQEISDFQKVEDEQSLQDKLQLEIDNTKNDLESLIFSTMNELKSLKTDDQNEESQTDIEKMNKQLESIHIWFEENEFERLSLEEYKSKINEINEVKKEIAEQLQYESKLNQIQEIKQSLHSLLDKVKNDTDRIQFEESLLLQSSIPKQIESLEDLIKSTKSSIVSLDIEKIRKELKETESKVEALQAIPIMIKKRVKRRRNNRAQQQQQQLGRTWSPFGFFDDFNDPWGPRRNRNNFFRQPDSDEDYEYDYEYEKVDEKDRRKQQQNNGKNNQRRSSSQLNNQEQMRKEAQKQEFLRRQKMEQEEQLRRQKAAQIEMENRRRQKLEQEEQLRRQKAAQIEMENRRRQQIEQEKIRRAKEAEMMRREYGYPFSRTSNPQRQSARSRQQQQRRVMPGYGYPFGF